MKSILNNTVFQILIAIIAVVAFLLAYIFLWVLSTGWMLVLHIAIVLFVYLLIFLDLNPNSEDEEYYHSDLLS